MQISPFFNGKVMQDYCFYEFVDLIGDIRHALYSWETLPHADPWLIAQLSLLFLSYVLSSTFVT